VRLKEPGKSKTKESANSTISATHAANNSRVKRILVMSRALWPKEIKATSEKVITVGSKSIHLARSLAVQLVTVAPMKRVIIPQSQPAYFIPIGKLRRPTPIRTLLNVSTTDQESSGEVKNILG
jgi:hypothetical protein